MTQTPVDFLEREMKRDELINKLIGYADHDNNCSSNAFGLSRCNCGLSETITAARECGLVKE